MLSFLTSPEGAATFAFATLVVFPLARRIAKRTKTPVDDEAVSLLERVANALRGIRK